MESLPLRAPRWIGRYAEHVGESRSGPLLPSSVASTASIEVPGLEIFHDFVEPGEAAELLAAVDSRSWDTNIKRRVQHYGHAFDYAKLAIAEGPAPSLPEFCKGLTERLNELLPNPVDQLTVNEYQPGVGIAFHTDAHSAFEDGISAVTLGAGIVMEFRLQRKVSFGKHHRLSPPPESEESVVQKNVWLPANSLFIIRGEARYAWQHGIAWRKTDCLDEGHVLQRGRRVSLTFRTARWKPCDCHWPTTCDGQNPEAHALPSRVGQDRLEA